MAGQAAQRAGFGERAARLLVKVRAQAQVGDVAERMLRTRGGDGVGDVFGQPADLAQAEADRGLILAGTHLGARSEEHTSELQSLMRISYAVFCLKKKTNK